MPSSRKPVSVPDPAVAICSRPGVLGFLGLGLDDWFRLRAWAADRSGRSLAAAQELHPRSGWPAAPRTLTRSIPSPRRPADVRGEFKPIATSVPGLQISEVFPKLAKIMDRVTLIRSMTSPEADHGRASHHLLTGYRPMPGARLSQLWQRGLEGARSRSRGMLPPYVAIPDGPAFLIERLPDAGLRPVCRLGRSQPGELPGPQPDSARQAHPGSPAPPPGHGQVPRRVCPRCSAHDR